MKDILTLADLGPQGLDDLIGLSMELAADRAAGRGAQMLRGKTLAMLFMKPSLRTRVSFDVAMLELGGHALYLSPAEVGLGSRESVPDVARVLSRYVHAIMARVFAHDDVVTLGRHASVPVINGLSDRAHPCQALADLVTIESELGGRRGRRLAYVGDGNNVAHSLMLGGALSGMSVAIVHPEGYAPDAAILAEAREVAAANGGEVMSVTDIGACDGADVLYTDVWTSMGQEGETETRRRAFEPYRLDAQLLHRAARGAIVMHCLPAHRGEEITDDVIDGPQSRVFQQAENRLHAQKALLLRLIRGEVLVP